VCALWISSTHCCVIWDNYKCRSRKGWRRSVVLGVYEGKDYVIWSRAREITTVLDIGPCWIWLFKESKAVIVHILKPTVVEPMRRNLVGAFRVALEDDTTLATLR